MSDLLPTRDPIAVYRARIEVNEKLYVADRCRLLAERQPFAESTAMRNVLARNQAAVQLLLDELSEADAMPKEKA